MDSMVMGGYNVGITHEIVMVRGAAVPGEVFMVELNAPVHDGYHH